MCLCCLCIILKWWLWYESGPQSNLDTLIFDSFWCLMSILPLSSTCFHNINDSKTYHVSNERDEKRNLSLIAKYLFDNEKELKFGIDKQFQFVKLKTIQLSIMVKSNISLIMKPIKYLTWEKFPTTTTFIAIILPHLTWQILFLRRLKRFSVWLQPQNEKT